MFFGFFLFINSSPRLTLYRHIVAINRDRGVGGGGGGGAGGPPIFLKL